LPEGEKAPKGHSSKAFFGMLQFRRYRHRDGAMMKTPSKGHIMVVQDSITGAATKHFVVDAEDVKKQLNELQEGNPHKLRILTFKAATREEWERSEAMTRKEIVVPKRGGEV
jgi:hypothetical protein